MDRGLACARLFIGRDLQMVAEVSDGVEVEGKARLRPGREVEIVRGGPHGEIRRAHVQSWRVCRIAADGITFRGVCHWV